MLFKPILEEGAVEILVRLTSHEDPSLRLNGIWGLMVRCRDSVRDINSTN